MAEQSAIQSKTQPSTPKKRSAVLSISTTHFARPLIDIDGTMYEMRHPDELSVPLVEQTLAAERDLASAEKGEGGAQFEAVVEAIDRLLAVVMADLPDEVRDRLSPRQRMRIITTFNKLGADDNAPSPAS